MADRYVEIDIERTQYSSIWLLIDDEDERFKNLFIPDSKKKWEAYRALRPIIKQVVDETMYDGDWEDGDDVGAIGSKEMSKEEAENYEIWNVKKEELK